MTRTNNTTCTQCDSGFYKRPAQIKATKNNFCSRECYSKWRLSNNRKICPVCGNEFHPDRREQTYCSISCSASRVRDIKWNGNGKSRPEYFRRIFYEHGWDGECMVVGCSYAKVHQNHRYVEGSNGGKYVFGNVFALCPNHHAEIHSGITEVEKKNDLELLERLSS